MCGSNLPIIYNIKCFILLLDPITLRESNTQKYNTEIQHAESRAETGNGMFVCKGSENGLNL